MKIPSKIMAIAVELLGKSVILLDSMWTHLLRQIQAYRLPLFVRNATVHNALICRQQCQRLVVYYTKICDLVYYKSQQPPKSAVLTLTCSRIRSAYLGIITVSHAQYFYLVLQNAYMIIHKCYVTTYPYRGIVLLPSTSYGLCKGLIMLSNYRY